MHCRQCHERVGDNWIEWRQRHVARLGEFQFEVITVEQVTLCGPPRVCAQEYAEQATALASKIAVAEMGDEPF